MTTTETTARRVSLFGQLLTIIAMLLIVIAGVLAAVWLMSTVPGVAPMAAPQALPTAAVRVPPFPAPRPQTSQEGSGRTIDPQPMVIPGIAQNAATAQAMFDAAVQAGEQPQQNVNLTGDTAPVIHGQRTNDRQPAGENVPTAEPVQVVTDWFGNKQKPINIQETHTCLHGQVWNGKGCHNP